MLPSKVLQLRRSAMCPHCPDISGACKVGVVVPQFYKHFVPPGLKTTTENKNFLYCDDFRNAILADTRSAWNGQFMADNCCDRPTKNHRLFIDQFFSAI